MSSPVTILCLASYFKGERFMRKAAELGAKVYLLTQERLLGHAWPRESLADVFAQRNGAPLDETIRTVSYLARTIPFNRIVALDDFDVETAAALREHLRMPGMGDTTARHFRDKLAMRVKAEEAGIPVPEYVHVLNYDQVREFMKRVPAPWMNKPRSEASATGITKVQNEAQLWELVQRQGDRQSHFLLERYLPGDVYHVDSIVSERKVLFSSAARCGKPPFDVAHGGGIFTTQTVERGSADEKAIMELNDRVLACMNLVRGVSHVEYIKAKDDGRFYLLECAARVGGAHIAEMIEAATGVNLWEEWAKIEVLHGKGTYTLPPQRNDYGGLLMTLVAADKPDLTAFQGPELFFTSPEKNHVGLVVRASTKARVDDLIAKYLELVRPMVATLPAPERPLH